MMKSTVVSVLALSVLGVNAQQFSVRTAPIALNLAPDAPTVTWISPKDANVASKEKSIMLKIRVESTSKITSIVLQINDQEVPMSRGISLGGRTTAQTQDIEQAVDLIPGMNRIVIKLTNEEGGVAEVSRNIAYNFHISGRQDRALIFAVNEYSEWNDLSNPIFDAKAIEEELDMHYGFETELVLNPTKINILEKIREYAGKSYGKKDQLLIFFAGHGKFDEVTRMGYLAATDSKVHDLVAESYVSHSAYRDFINNIPCEHTLVMIDACFGGTFDQVLARASSRGGDATFFELTRSEFIERKLKFTTRKYLTSGGKVYVPDGRPGAHSPFARKVLEALRNYGGSDKVLTYTEFLTYFEALNPQPRSGEFGANEPGSDFIFVAK